MRIPKQLVEASASRSWRTDAIDRKPRALPLDDVDAALEEPPVSQSLPPSSVPPRAPRPLAPGDVLHAALLAVAGDDAACEMLLASADDTAREQLSARLAYLEFSTLEGRKPALSALLAALNAAPDDAARAATLGGASPAMCAQLAEHLWASSAPCDVVAQRYMDLVIL
jgi:hypothetical protein